MADYELRNLRRKMKEKAWRQKKEETGRGRASCRRHNVAAGGGIQPRSSNRITWTLQPTGLAAHAACLFPTLSALNNKNPTALSTRIRQMERLCGFHEDGTVLTLVGVTRGHPPGGPGWVTSSCYSFSIVNELDWIGDIPCVNL